MKINIVLFFSLIISIQIAIHNKNMNDIEIARSKILENQIVDMSNQIIELNSRRTYEDGVRDGFEKRKDQSYVDGYHAATEQMSLQKYKTVNVAE